MQFYLIREQIKKCFIFLYQTVFYRLVWYSSLQYQEFLETSIKKLLLFQEFSQFLKLN